MHSLLCKWLIIEFESCASLFKDIYIHIWAVAVVIHDDKCNGSCPTSTCLNHMTHHLITHVLTVHDYQ